jgi:isopentenyl-diphosphate delta-isomerase
MLGEASVRKLEHIKLAKSAQTDSPDRRFFYEPLLSAHPKKCDLALSFLGKYLEYPLWISSMTGNKKINFNLAMAAKHFKIGISLGSIRSLLEGNGFDSFNIRDIIGKDILFFVNLGVAQVEKLIYKREQGRINQLISRLRGDGLVVHVNPLQEWLQKEGDRLDAPPLETLKKLLKSLDYPLIVKEAGQGMGPGSVKKLLQLNIAAMELAAFGGTNFSKLEDLRSGRKSGFERVGHDVNEMIDFINSAKSKCDNFIISGGVNNMLDACYYLKKLKGKSLIGNAFKYLKVASSFAKLKQTVEEDMKLLALANCYLKVR